MGIGSRLQILMAGKSNTPIQLAKAIQVPEQTIYSILKRDSKKVSIDVLLSICDYYKVGVDFFSDEYKGFDITTDPVPQTFTERQIITLCHRLNDEGQKKVLGYICDLTDTGKYIKDDGVAENQPHKD